MDRLGLVSPTRQSSGRSTAVPFRVLRLNRWRRFLPLTFNVKALMFKGVITQGEFEAKKKPVLSR